LFLTMTHPTLGLGDVVNKAFSASLKASLMKN